MLSDVSDILVTHYQGIYNKQTDIHLIKLRQTPGVIA